MKISKIIAGTFVATTLIMGFNSYSLKEKLTTKGYEMGVLNNRHYVELERLKSEHAKAIREKEAKITSLNLTLETTFKDYQVIQTLLNKGMEDWTGEEVLAMRDQLDLLPYGSWFESGHYVTAPWGSTLLSGTHWGASGHRGVDIKPLSGNPYEIVRSTVSGRVITWGRNDKLFGNYLVIESSDGMFQMKLAHLSSIAVFTPQGEYDLYEGMEFEAGTRIARMGNTGHTTGPHLHIEYYIREDDGWRLLNASAILDYIGEGETAE